MKVLRLELIIFIIISLILLGIKYMPTVNVPKGTFISSNKNDDLKLSELNIPDGFKIDVYAENVVNARSMCLSPNGTLFVGTRDEGSVYALRDTDGDFKIDKQFLIYQEGNMPNGVAFKDGDLYVAEVSRILKFENIEDKLSSPPNPKIVYDDYPTDRHHGWKYIAFGPDDKLYVPVGAPCNVCEADEIYSSITRINPDGTDLEIIQHGVRNTVGFNWHPETNELWFTDNGRDMMGDDMPACELNRASKENQHFGFPYCHQGDTPDPEFGKNRTCDEFTKPVQNLGAHVAPLGMEFYQSGHFPSAYANVVFVAEHGSWNRSKKSGYRVSMVRYDENFNSIEYVPFIDGWMDDESQDVWGRPVDLEYLPDGSMLISDDYADVIYRVSYEK